MPKSKIHHTPTFLSQGNAALREKNFIAAMSFYLQAAKQKPGLGKVIAANIRLTQQKYQQQRSSLPTLKLAIFGQESVGRMTTLAQLNQPFAKVEIIVTTFRPPGVTQIDAGFKQTNFPVHSFIVEDQSRFLEQAVELVGTHPYDVVHLSNPSAANILIGLLYKVIWGAKIIVDIDDENLISTSVERPFDIEVYLEAHPKLPTISFVKDGEWVHLSLALAKEFDGLTVSNSTLQRHFGGESICSEVNPQQHHVIYTYCSDLVLSKGLASLAQAVGGVLDVLLLNAVVQASKSLTLNRESQSLTNSQVDVQKVASFELERPASMEPFYFDLIKKSGFFDVNWYLKQYQAKYNIDINPLEHYLTYGIEKSLNPSAAFDTRHYLKSNPDVASSEIHPFVHYATQGYKEGRTPLPAPPVEYVSRYIPAEQEYIPRLPMDAETVEKAVKVIAFYLPQFHAIPENDKWWGEGFTEWTNVRPAKPQFEGHYQPHVPDDYLGHYNLLDNNVQRKQVDLAKQYGIEGFCFYSYWFTGHRLLQQPVDNYLNDSSLDLPFCVCWANENWSRRWDGLDHDLLMVQNYSDQDDLNFIAETSKYLRDHRYIRVNGKPLLLVYRPNLFPSMRATAERWRTWCRENGIGEIYLAYPQSFESVDPSVYGFDAAIEFPPNNSAPPNITPKMAPSVIDFETTVYDWRVLLERSETYKNPGYKVFRSACPSWDNTARKKNKGTVFHNSCPKLFTKWLTNAFSDTLTRIENKDEQIVFVNAWNEWAEGAHLEPDQRYGYAWLQSVRDAHQEALRKRKRIVIVSHDAHPHGAQILCLNFAKYFKEQFNFSVEMIVLGEGRLIEKYENYATVHCLDLANEDRSAVDALLVSLRKKGAEIAIVNTTVSGKLVPQLKAHGFGVVSLIHELPGILNAYGLQEHAARISEFADKVVFPAKQVQDGFEGFIGKQLPQAIIRSQGIYLRSLLREGANKDEVRVSVRQKLGLPGNAKIIMCAGYADYRKGFDLFVRACIKVAHLHPDMYAVWVGHLDQAFVDSSLKIAEDAGLRDHFVFTGLVEQPQEFYLAADVYALTSREDPFPSVVMEALDALTPVVAFKGCGGFENLLQRDCGLLVAAEDCDAYADAITYLLDNPKRAHSLSKNGQVIIENEYSFKHYLFDLIHLAGRPMPKVSVIVPNYNYENFILERLQTIANQTYPIFELIVLDDQSPDDSVTVIQNFLRNCQIPSKLEINETNSGSVFRQWRKGIEMARGDLVWIAEADDLADPTFLEALIPFFDDSEVVMAYSQSKQINETNEVLAPNYLDYTNDIGDFWREDYVINGSDEIKRALCIKNVIPNVSGVIFRREILQEILKVHGDELPEYKVAGDWAMYLYLAMAGKIGFSAQSLNLHRRHSSSVTKSNNHLNEVIQVQELVTRITDIDAQKLNAMSEYIAKLRLYFVEAASS